MRVLRTMIGLSLFLAVGLAMVIALFRLRVTVDTDRVDLLKR